MALWYPPVLKIRALAPSREARNTGLSVIARRDVVAAFSAASCAR